MESDVYAPPAAPVADRDEGLELSVAWQFGIPKVRQVFLAMAALWGVALMISLFAAFAQPLAALLLGSVQLVLILLLLGLAALSGRRPLLAVYGGVAFYIFVFVIPALLVPATIAQWAFMKVLAAVLLYYAWKTAREIEAHPRLVPAD